MEVYELQDDFGLENVVRTQRPDPEPGPEEVLIEMKYVSLNFRDRMVIEGQYNPNLELPIIPLSDGVGEVLEVGDGVDRVETGDRVIPIFAQDWIDGDLTREIRASTLGSPLDGTLAERVVLDQHGVVRAPDHLTDEEAATLPCAGLTAWNALTRYGRVKAGDRVLLQGSGGVSVFALQFAKTMGAQVMITSSQEKKLKTLESLGADRTLNYKKQEDWDRAALDWTDGRGVDFVVEVGGAGTLQKSMNATRPGGQLSVIGVLSGGHSDLSITPVLMKTLRVQGIFVGNRNEFLSMNRAISDNEIHPWVDRSFSFDEVQDAFEYVGEGKHIGKIAIEIGS